MLLNIKKVKVHPIERRFYDLENFRKKLIVEEKLFVINTSGETKYNSDDFQNL